MNTYLRMGLFLAAFCSFAPVSTFPIEQPYTQGYLTVSPLHDIFYAQYGNPAGVPIVVVHGGPGFGCSDSLSRFFDLSRFHVIMFDQRGAMRSKPFTCMQENTTQDSIHDMEMLRKHLGIKKWVLFGSSWGSLLSILYGQAYPESCLGFIVSGIFLGRKQDIRLFDTEERTAQAYEQLIELIPAYERTDLYSAFYSRVMHADPAIHLAAARAGLRYHLIRTSAHPLSSSQLDAKLSNDRFVLSVARAVLHYTVHDLFIRENQALEDMHRISHIPTIIIHGDQDANCSVSQAHELHTAWDNSSLRVVTHDAHAYDEAMQAALVVATQEFAAFFADA